MTEITRWNLQHGIQEDKRFSYKTYTAESPLDSLILARKKNRKLLFDEAEYNRFVDKAGKDIAAAADRELLKIFK